MIQMQKGPGRGATQPSIIASSLGGVQKLSKDSLSALQQQAALKAALLQQAESLAASAHRNAREALAVDGRPSGLLDLAEALARRSRICAQAAGRIAR